MCGRGARALLKLIMPDVRAKHRSKHRRGFIYESIDSVSSGDIAPTIQGDVRQWYALLEAKDPKYVSQDPAVWKWDIVFASPPCEKFSFGNKNVTKKQEREALQVVQACLDCVWLLRPTVYFIENSYGRLWKTKLMEPYLHQMYVVAQNAKIELKIELELDFLSKSIELRNKNRAQIWASQRAGDLFPQGAQVPVQVHSQRR